jgi:hypothetical protein
METTTQLTIKELRFVEAYLESGFNGAAAYRKAYNTDNSNVAKAEAYKMLRKPKIIKAIDASEISYKQLARQLNLSRRDIVEELKNIIRGNEKKNTLIAINLLCRLLGDYGAEKIEINKYSFDTNADISKMTPEEREEYKRKILAAL